MNKNHSISLIVLTLNEELHLKRCLESVGRIVSQIIIIDSGSTDKTLDIAHSFSADVYSHKFKNQADQFNWALENADIKGDWILKLDADEYLTKELREEISFFLNPLTPRLRSGLRFRLGFEKKQISSFDTDINGFYMKRRVVFMGRWIRHGGYYPRWFLRLFRKGKGRSEIREMDEHLVLTEGKAGKLKNDFVDENLKDLYSWTAKHNDFSSREAKERYQASQSAMKGSFSGSQSERTRWMKNSIYLKLPKFFRAFLYFKYRYILRLGFLDGKEGFIFHFLQGLWHQFLIDAKMHEKEKETRNKTSE